MERRRPPTSPGEILHEEYLAPLGLTQRDVTEAAWWVEPDGRRRRGHEAIAASLRAIGGVWGVLGRVLTLPGISLLSALGYSLIAKYRYRLPGSTDACRLPADR